MSKEPKWTRTILKYQFEYQLVRVLIAFMGWLPRGFARSAGASLGSILYRVFRKLRDVGDRNLSLAFPAMSAGERTSILKGTFEHLGRHLAEFCQMDRYSKRFALDHVMRYEGLHHYLAAAQDGKGVLVLTGHLGAWELSSFLHSLLGYPMGMVIRRLDNPLLDQMVNQIRCKHGNRVLHKDDFARGLLHAMARGETVGVLMDTNMTPPQGVFVPFFGLEACTASGVARIARKTGAAVLPGFLLWSEREQRYVLRFGERLELQRSANAEDDVLQNTALFARVTEAYIREYPEQWLWLHRRWKTRPAGQPSLYNHQHVS